MIFFLLNIAFLHSQSPAFVRTCVDGIKVNYQGLTGSNTDSSNIQISAQLLRVPLSLSELHNACDPISEDFTGKIAVIDRGICSFNLKLKHVQDQGAIGAIICNFDSTANSMNIDDPTVVIPAMSLAVQDCGEILMKMDNGIVEANFSFANTDIEDCLSTPPVGIVSEHGSIYVKNQDGIVLQGLDDNCYLMYIDSSGDFAKKQVICPE